jgi:ectoine hydroxylase-related dioxygenase (phytanoyl-CoA dioxygenase family)
MGSCMVALTPTTRANGCLQVLRGSHAVGLIRHERVEGQAAAEQKRVTAAEAVLPLDYVEMLPGDALFCEY